MAVVEKSILIERSAAQMFELVDGVENYPKFLPWCGGTELHERSDTRTVATIRIDYLGIRAAFSTVNDKEIPRWMHITLRDGPFRKMDGGWKFTELGQAACKVEFQLHYEFSSRILEKALGPVFHRIVNTFVDSFVKRAQQVYG